MRRSIQMVVWIVAGLVLAGLTIISALFVYYRPTVEWVR